MSNIRFDAVKKLGNPPKTVQINQAQKITGIFNDNVFTLAKARQFLSDDA